MGAHPGSQIYEEEEEILVIELLLDKVWDV